MFRVLELNEAIIKLFFKSYLNRHGSRNQRKVVTSAYLEHLYSVQTGGDSGGSFKCVKFEIGGSLTFANDVLILQTRASLSSGDAENSSRQ